MSSQSAAAGDTSAPASSQVPLAAASPGISRPVTLDTPIQREGQSITSLQLRKPMSGELRGLALLDLAQMDVDSLHTLLPRICVPFITKAEAMAMEASDLFALGAEVAGFLPQRAQRAAYPVS